MKIFATAKEAGSAAALVNPIKELQRRGHQVSLYAAGSAQEARGFRDLPYEIIPLEAGEERAGERLFQNRLPGHDIVLSGLHNHRGSDGNCIRAARALGIPSIGVLDQNSNYRLRLGEQAENLPTFLAVMDEQCLATMRQQLSSEIGEEAVRRCRITGWSAFDHYARLREEFNAAKREELLHRLGLNPDKEAYFHATQNIAPTAGEAGESLTAAELGAKEAKFRYELQVTSAAFAAAADLGLKLLVKPHPKEMGDYTMLLAQKHGFNYVPANSCLTADLLLSSYSVTAGKSTCITEGCLLNRNTAAFLPGEYGRALLQGSPAIINKAVPYTTEWSDFGRLLQLVTSRDGDVCGELAESRKKFSVDGKASQRLADLVEQFGS